MKRHALWIVLAVTVTSCGGGSSSPTAPTAPVAPAAPTVTGVTVNGLDALRQNFFTNYTATQTLSNGATQTPTAVTWTSDNPGVASVEANGDVNGNANGTATITATVNGVRGSKTIRVVANFGGTWSGTYRLNKCDESGQFRGQWCQQFTVGASYPMSMNLTQGGATRDQVLGTLALGSIGGPLSGNVTGDGRLILGGSFLTTGGTATFRFVIGGWETRLVGQGGSGMSGGWAHTMELAGLTGNAYQENVITSLTHLTQGTKVEREP